MKIPIEFDYEGVLFSGTFHDIHGAGAETYHLYDLKNFYLGRLRKAHDQWVFDSSKFDFSELAGFFSNVIQKNMVADY